MVMTRIVIMALVWWWWWLWCGCGDADRVFQAKIRDDTTRFARSWTRPPSPGKLTDISPAFSPEKETALPRGNHYARVWPEWLGFDILISWPSPSFPDRLRYGTHKPAVLPDGNRRPEVLWSAGAVCDAYGVHGGESVHVAYPRQYYVRKKYIRRFRVI